MEAGIIGPQVKTPTQITQLQEQIRTFAETALSLYQEPGGLVDIQALLSAKSSREKNQVAQYQIRKAMSGIVMMEKGGIASFKRKIAKNMRQTFDYLGRGAKGTVRNAICGWEVFEEGGKVSVPGLSDFEQNLFFAMISLNFTRLAGIVDLAAETVNEKRFADFLAQVTFIKSGPRPEREEILEVLLTQVIDRDQTSEFDLNKIVEELLKRDSSGYIFNQLIKFGKDNGLLEEVLTLFESHYTTAELVRNYDRYVHF